MHRLECDAGKGQCLVFRQFTSTKAGITSTANMGYSSCSCLLPTASTSKHPKTQMGPCPSYEVLKYIENILFLKVFHFTLGFPCSLYTCYKNYTRGPMLGMLQLMSVAVYVCQSFQTSLISCIIPWFRMINSANSFIILKLKF